MNHYGVYGFYEHTIKYTMPKFINLIKIFKDSPL